MEQQQVASAEQLQQQKKYKTAKENFRSQIKLLSTEQVAAKIARKGDGNDSYKCATVAHNSYKLMHLFIAYYQYRSANSTYKKTMQVPKEKVVGGIKVPGYDQDYVDRLIKEHAEGTVHLNP